MELGLRAKTKLNICVNAEVDLQKTANFHTESTSDGTRPSGRGFVGVSVWVLGGTSEGHD